MRAEVRHVTQTASQIWEAVEQSVYAYELDFRDGQIQTLERYLPSGNTSLRKTVLVELIKVELELLWKKGPRRQLKEYPERYSELGTLDELPPDLIYEAYRVACQHGEGEELEQFCNAFPSQRDAVISLAYRTVNQSTAITRQKPGGHWHANMQFGDFELVTLLGEGAFGKVFLARQLSLARQVAVKITANRGSEARTMASLEHDNIVQVHSELILPQHNARLLCMQYVPGTTFGKIIQYLADRPTDDLSGASIVAAIDELATIPAPFEAAALKQRQRLVEADLVEAITLLGSQLAEALSYAHERGVVHRDIKPDNVLMSQYGRPLLVDFNLSLDPHQIAGTSAGMFGGSLSYMAPEHLDAFNPTNDATPDVVDERSDIFSLGVTLFELLHLQRPFPDPPARSNPLECLDAMATERRSSKTFHDPGASSVTDALDATIRRCLAPAPKDRFQTAEEMCESLEAARELHGIRKTLPAPGHLMRFAIRRPLLMLALAVLVPSLLGSCINISYNVLCIASSLTTDQMAMFHRLLLIYNLTVYPLCVALLVHRARPLSFTRSSGLDAAQLRRRIVTLPVWIVGLGALGWIPGGIVFPLALHVSAGPVNAAIFGHFLTDFTLSGLIAVTYSYFGAETILLRVLYPRYLIGQPRPREAARNDLRGVPRRIRMAQVLAAIIPLVAAILIVLMGPVEQEGDEMFRFLVVAVIDLGMIGFSFSLTAVGVLQKTLQALIGGPRERRSPELNEKG